MKAWALSILTAKTRTDNSKLQKTCKYFENLDLRHPGVNATLPRRRKAATSMIGFKPHAPKAFSAACEGMTKTMTLTAAANKLKFSNRTSLAGARPFFIA